jgi:hypothetical protein
MIIFKNFTLFRSSDLSVMVLIGYNVAMLFSQLPVSYFIWYVKEEKGGGKEGNGGGRRMEVGGKRK